MYVFVESESVLMHGNSQKFTLRKRPKGMALSIKLH